MDRLNSKGMDWLKGMDQLKASLTVHTVPSYGSKLSLVKSWNEVLDFVLKGQRKKSLTFNQLKLEQISVLDINLKNIHSYASMYFCTKNGLS